MGRIRWLWLGLALWASPCAAQQGFMGPVPTTQASMALPTSTQAITKLISGIANKYTYITSMHISAVANAVITWSYGTGTNCGTGTTIMDGPSTFSGAPFSWGNGAGAIMVAPQGNDICLTVTTQAISGSVAYGQF